MGVLYSSGPNERGCFGPAVLAVVLLGGAALAVANAVWHFLF